MIKRTSAWVLISLLFASVLVSCSPESANSTVSGVVVSESAPIAGAVVRVKASSTSTITDADGHFSLTGLSADQLVFITAWHPGYFINGVEDVLPGESDVEIHLEKHSDNDHPEYEFLSAFSSAGSESNCQNCHAEEGTSNMPFTEWQQDAHALSAQNPRFISMYLGQDFSGNQSPTTQYGYTRDYGSFPFRPDPDQPYYGPGYKLDFPDTDGNCAACHAPVAAVNNAYSTDPTHLTGVEAEGAACDFCHKVWDVRLDPASGLPYPNTPGVLSFEFRRPPEGHQFFAGPLDDVAPGEDTFSPIQQESQYCAACHFGVFWDTVIYNSFGEWLDSPYSDPENGRTCQDCHMPAGNNDHFALIEMGGVERDPSTIFSHRMLGASDAELLENAVTMSVSVRRENQQIIVEVTIENDQTGHHVPTDSPLRELILLVQVQGPDGEIADHISGPTVPDWGGIGSAEDGYYAGLPGKGYAKILTEIWTQATPTGAYWNPTRIVSDNRLAAFEADTSTYTFEPAQDGEATVIVTLLFRRAFIELMDLKGWDVPDIIMEQTRVTIP